LLEEQSMRFVFMRRLATKAALAAGLSLSMTACGSAGDDVDSSTAGGDVVLTGAGGAGGGGSSSGNGGGGAGGHSPGKLGPPYPIVLAHGFFGFEDFAGAGFLSYFYGVKDHLAQQGELDIHTPAVDPFNSSDYRADQLIAKIEAILAETGHEKVTLIGHSQGGLDARAVAYKRPDLVASVVTVATPHYGSPVADVVLKYIDDPDYQDALNELLKLIGAPLYDEIGNETDVFKPLYLFSQQGSAEFNASHPDQPGVFYASVTGRSDDQIGGPECEPDVAQSFITKWDAVTDPIDIALAISEGIVDGGFDSEEPNDGLVRVVDARWGQFWGCIPADHLDQVGQLLGDGAGGDNEWNHLEFYSKLVARVRLQGF
jgi:triacylglycerol lipase